MELELKLKINHTRDDITSFTDFQLAKDHAGPLFISKETETMFILIAYLKGFGRENIKIKITEDGTRVEICGQRPVQEMTLVGWIWHKEVELREFKKVFQIPEGVNLDRMKAKFNEEESILRITMPKLVSGMYGTEIQEVREEIDGGRSEDTEATDRVVQQGVSAVHGIEMQEVNEEIDRVKPEADQVLERVQREHETEEAEKCCQVGESTLIDGETGEVSEPLDESAKRKIERKKENDEIMGNFVEMYRIEIQEGTEDIERGRAETEQTAASDQAPERKKRKNKIQKMQESDQVGEKNVSVWKPEIEDVVDDESPENENALEKIAEQNTEGVEEANQVMGDTVDQQQFEGEEEGVEDFQEMESCGLIAEVKSEGTKIHETERAREEKVDESPENDNALTEIAEQNTKGEEETNQTVDQQQFEGEEEGPKDFQETESCGLIPEVNPEGTEIDVKHETEKAREEKADESPENENALTEIAKQNMKWEEETNQTVDQQQFEGEKEGAEDFQETKICGSIPEVNPEGTKIDVKHETEKAREEKIDESPENENALTEIAEQNTKGEEETNQTIDQQQFDGEEEGTEDFQETESCGSIPEVNPDGTKIDVKHETEKAREEKVDESSENENALTEIAEQNMKGEEETNQTVDQQQFEGEKEGAEDFQETESCRSIPEVNPEGTKIDVKHGTEKAKEEKVDESPKNENALKEIAEGNTKGEEEANQVMYYTVDQQQFEGEDEEGVEYFQEMESCGSIPEVKPEEPKIDFNLDTESAREEKVDEDKAKKLQGVAEVMPPNIKSMETEEITHKENEELANSATYIEKTMSESEQLKIEKEIVQSPIQEPSHTKTSHQELPELKEQQEIKENPKAQKVQERMEENVHGEKRTEQTEVDNVTYRVTEEPNLLVTQSEQEHNTEANQQVTMQESETQEREEVVEISQEMGSSETIPQEIPQESRIEIMEETERAMVERVSKGESNEARVVSESAVPQIVVSMELKITVSMETAAQQPATSATTNEETAEVEPNTNVQESAKPEPRDEELQAETPVPADQPNNGDDDGQEDDEIEEEANESIEVPEENEINEHIYHQEVEKIRKQFKKKARKKKCYRASERCRLSRRIICVGSTLLLPLIVLAPNLIKSKKS